MVAGFDRYVQVAKCFRDEDLRADRQPEFTQLDLEMSFVDAEDIIAIIDGLVSSGSRRRFSDAKSNCRCLECLTKKRCGDSAAINPTCDTRWKLSTSPTSPRRLSSGSSAGRPTRVDLFAGSRLTAGRRVFAAAFGRVDRVCQTRLRGARAGLVPGRAGWFALESDEQELYQRGMAKIVTAMSAKPGDLLLFLADSWNVTCRGLAGLRKRLGAELKLYAADSLHCSWITEFPMFEKDEETGNWHAKHHPFTAPLASDLPLLKTDPEACRAQAYDLVINGSEAGGGNDPDP
jgi:aspartyl-tRNA synthetase